VLNRLRKTAAISRQLIKKAGLLGMAGSVGKAAVMNPGTTALTVGGGIAAKNAFSDKKKGFKAPAGAP
jgi:hypothetical protein